MERIPRSILKCNTHGPVGTEGVASHPLCAYKKRQYPLWWSYQIPHQQGVMPLWLSIPQTRRNAILISQQRNGKKSLSAWNGANP
jgi:hypothetical protein